MEELTKAINLWYREWLNINDPYETDFEGLLHNQFPNHIFSLHKEEWIFIKTL